MYHNIKSYQIPNHNFITKVTYNYQFFPTLVLYLVLYLGIVSGEQTRSLRSRSLISQANMDGHSALYLDSYLRKTKREKKREEKLVFDHPSKYIWAFCLVPGFIFEKIQRGKNSFLISQANIDGHSALYLD